MQFRYFIVGLVLLGSCVGKADHERMKGERVSLQQTALLDTTETLELNGQQLAQAYCQACHAFPEPSLLDKATWQRGVLPQMALRLGINKTGSNPYMRRPQQEIIDLLQAGIYPDQPLMAERDWEKIEAYYLQNAPEQLAQPTAPEASKVIKGFTIVVPALHQGRPPMTTMLKYVPQVQTLWVGDRRNWLYRLNGDLQAIDSVQLVSAPVDLIQEKESYKVLTIGTMDPSDLTDGKLFQRAALSANNAQELLLEGLRRPVDIIAADLNEDQKEDLVVCNYGNNLGSLVWYRNKGIGIYEPIVLKHLPGARKIELADLDQDGRKDLVVLFAQGTEAIKVFYNKGRGRFEEKNLVQFPPVYGLSYFELADFNQDGFVDLLVANGDNADYSPILKPYHGIRILLNDGKNKFKETFFYPLPGASQVLARDFDQDGDLDIAAISFFPDFKKAPEKGFIYLEQQTKLRFQASTFEQSKLGHWLTMEAGDYDQDGDQDIILGSFAYTPAPLEFQKKWLEEGPSILVLKNELKKEQEVGLQQ